MILSTDYSEERAVKAQFPMANTMLSCADKSHGETILHPFSFEDYLFLCRIVNTDLQLLLLVTVGSRSGKWTM